MTQRLTDVEGWESSLPELAEQVHRLEFAKLAEFYREAEQELRRQAEEAANAGNTKAAQLLSHSALEATRMAANFTALISST